MFAKFAAIFKKPPTISIADLKIGDVVELTYYHPSEIGFLDDNQFTCTRLNDDELENRTIKGIVVNTFKNLDLLKWFIEVKTQKNYNGVPVERCFLLMENEIKSLRRIV
jgi:hypothetical protein